MEPFRKDGITAQRLVHTAPGRVEIQQKRLPAPTGRQLLVAADYSAISHGTERLAFLDQLPKGMALDASLPGLTGDKVRYPLHYGYSLVGRVEAAGPELQRPEEWIGRRVFAFRPHASHTLCLPEELLQVPEDISSRSALLFPTMETAISLVQDAAPAIGEEVALFGLGLVGSVTASLLRRFPLGLLAVGEVDPRRLAGSSADFHFDPSDDEQCEALRQRCHGEGVAAGVDIALEISGAPDALEQALSVTGQEGRVVVGSWYGDKPVSLRLGGRFHRQRMRLISSQVSTLAPTLRGRWDKQRRYQQVWRLLADYDAAAHLAEPRPLEQAQRCFEELAQGIDVERLHLFRYEGQGAPHDEEERA